MSDGWINDKQWRDLQTRAAKANPERARFGSEQSVRGAKRGKENYENRDKN